MWVIGRKETHCTPRSPVEKTSMRLRPKQANISTDLQVQITQNQYSIP
jgi:hypothetical protein